MYSFYDYMQDGGMPQMRKSAEPDGGMAMGQIMAMHEKLSALQKFIRPDSDLEPWVASKLTLADDYLNSVAEYMQYNPEENGEMEYDDEQQEGLPEEQMMKSGGYVVTRSSDRKGKTHKVTGPDGTVKYFGDSKLGQHPRDPERKAAFYARHKKNLAGNPYFRAFARKTWETGGEIPEMREGGYYGYNGDFHQASGSGTWSGNTYFDVGGENENESTAQQGVMGPQPVSLNGTTNAYSWKNLSQNEPIIKPEQLSPNFVRNPYINFGFSTPFGTPTYDESKGVINTTGNSLSRADTRNLGFTDDGLYIKEEAKRLQGTLDNGSGRDIRQGVNEFNQNFGTSLKTPGIVIGKKGRDAMQTMGAWSNAGKMAIGMASAATDVLVNNAGKKANRQRQMNNGMTDALNMVNPQNRGDWVTTGSRTGELRPDQYVTNKGMYTSQFYPSMNMMQFGGGMIDEAINMPMDAISTPERTGFSQPRMPVNNSTPVDFKLTRDFEDYASKAEKYIKSVNSKTDVTGQMLASGAQMAFEKTGKLVPVELALAQLHQEGYLAKGNKANRPQRTKNPFNVGNTDDGSSSYHGNLQSGINTYYDLLTTRYLNKRSPQELMQNFVNGAGNRYASDRNYESSLKKIVNQVQNRIFEEGGVYDLSEDEIRSILTSGGNVEFL